MKALFRLCFLSSLLCLLVSCQNETQNLHDLGNGWTAERTLSLDYAEQFSVDYFQDGHTLLILGNTERFLLIPEGKTPPEGLAEDIIPLQEPLQNIYLVASASMSFIDALDSLDRIALTGTAQDGWYNENVKTAMAEGKILYAGKYSAPDYELILSKNCALSIQSTMINQAPQVRENLARLGIPVLVDYASYESHPLGRTEWMKLYGVLFHKEAEAEALFAQQSEALKAVTAEASTGKTVSFFHISDSGYAVTRKSGDYISKMIALAGGEYIFSDLGDPNKARSTVTLDMETFYATAKDADVLLYNNTIGDGVRDLDALLAKHPLLKDFRAVQTGDVWCIGKNLYQDTTHLGDMIQDVHKVLTQERPAEENLVFLTHLD